MGNSENPLIVRPTKDQIVIVLPQRTSENPRPGRVKITGRQLAVEPNALEKLGDGIKLVANEFSGIQGRDRQSLVNFAMDSPDWQTIVRELRKERRTKEEIFKEIYSVFASAGVGEQKSKSYARTMYERLVGVALETPKPGTVPGKNRPFTRKNVW